MIGLIDVDGKLPNLALMKISSFYKSLGETVEFANSNLEKYEKIYASCLFSWNREKCEKILQDRPDAIIGGSGWSLTKELPSGIEGNSDKQMHRVSLSSSCEVHGTLGR